MNIPPQAAILARASELRSDAQRAHDASTVKALDSIIVTVVCHYASLEWAYQYLLVASASHAGMIHQVSAYGCTCEARKPCYHQRLRELLLDMFDTEVETADQDAELPLPAVVAPFLSCGLPNPLYRVQAHELARRIVAARSTCWSQI
jgi:hypothetical protein